jgi:hypothetical protein
MTLQVDDFVAVSVAPEICTGRLLAVRPVLHRDQHARSPSVMFAF